LSSSFVVIIVIIKTPLNHIHHEALLLQLALESRILHYLIVHILLSRSSNLAFEEDLIVMWTFQTYPHLVTLFLQHFNIPLDSEPYVPIKRSFLIVAAVVASFGYRKECDGSWVKKGAQPNDDEGHLLVEGDSSLLRSILDRFDGLQTYGCERFDSLERQEDTRFEEMNSRIAKVEEDVTIIHDCFDLPPPPPSV